jgi:hypothetical protein
MKLLNPLYDTVFKYLMQDIEIAKGLIEAITKCKIVEIIPAPQDSTTLNLKVKYLQMEIIKQDYVAVVNSSDKHGNQTTERIVIEVQKSSILPEIGRFRKYLADKYATTTAYSTKNTQKDSYLSMKTIYLIEQIFNPKLPAILGRRGTYYNELNNTEFIGPRDSVVELFNHDSWFIQTELLPAEFKDDLHYILTVFSPQFRTGKNERFIEIPEDVILQKKHKIMDLILRRLEIATADRKINEALDVEIQYERYIDSVLKQSQDDREAKAKAEASTKAAQKKAEKERAEKELAIQKEAEAKKNEALAKKNEALAKKNEADALAEKEVLVSKIAKLVLNLHTKGFSNEEIAENTGLSIEEVIKLLNSSL